MNGVSERPRIAVKSHGAGVVFTEVQFESSKLGRQSTVNRQSQANHLKKGFLLSGVKSLLITMGVFG